MVIRESVRGSQMINDIVREDEEDRERLVRRNTEEGKCLINSCSWKPLPFRKEEDNTSIVTQETKHHHSNGQKAQWDPRLVSHPSKYL